MEKFNDRRKAGKILAKMLEEYAGRSDVLVLALPRGGIPVGYEIAKHLSLPLEAFIVRKLGAPGHAELAMGAIASGGGVILNENVIRSYAVSPEDVVAAIQKQKQEIERREALYHGGRPFPHIANKTIILVDDGIATGATVHAAVAALRNLNPSAIIIATPVAEKNVCKKVEKLVDKFICPLQPEVFWAVGQWYDDFNQTSDEEASGLLQELAARA